MSFNSKYRYPTSPVADKNAIVQGEKYRFTVLTSRLIRIEYNENGIFEDRATQIVINREFPETNYKVEKNGDILKIITDDVELRYTGKPFSKNSLKVCYRGENSGVYLGTWYFGEKAKYNLKGTTRTLDSIDGSCEIEDGLMSKGEITVLDDSNSLIIMDNGQIVPREVECIDQYLFCYGKTDGSKFDYLACLKDFYSLAGKTPLLPRYVLGNWWSRYHAYTQQEYTNLMKRFKDEDIPFSVAVVDMDWHYVDIDPKYGTGWTGYTWNRELFPDHKEFLEFLHDEGMKVSLNLHPQEGVAAHEEAYKDMADAMGIDHKTGERVEFDITNPKFIENYFDVLHHPMEKEGVDFWWIDWQQGNVTDVPGLDPLWMLNHFHYIDNGRDKKRPMMFSRYACPGSHRYPIGFSGDVISTWKSLDFQPYFTATASNIGYGWWSHDIGGHGGGISDDELITRWVQLGVFSPINRLHGSQNPFTGKEPWKYNKISEISMKKFLKLRHELIPYLYTMNYRANKYDEPLVQPIYYKWKGDEVYNFKNEYSFGTEMIVSPITKPHDEETQLGSVYTYLPEGVWYDFFSGRRYSGKRTITVYRNMYDMPVFVKAGGIIPMAQLVHINDTENPKNIKIKVYAGADNIFEMYEDDGESLDFLNGKYAITKMELKWSKQPEFTVFAPEGDQSILPEKRNYTIEFIGIEESKDITVTQNGTKINFEVCNKEGITSVKVPEVSGMIKVKFNNDVSEKCNDVIDDLYTLLLSFKIESNIKRQIFANIKNLSSPIRRMAYISEENISDNIKKAIYEIIGADTI